MNGCFVSIKIVTRNLSCLVKMHLRTTLFKCMEAHNSVSTGLSVLAVPSSAVRPQTVDTDPVLTRFYVELAQVDKTKTKKAGMLK